MCGEHQAPAVLSEWKQTPYPMNMQISGPQHKTSYWGAWNSVVGIESYRNIVGSHGLGRRNHRGQILITFVKEMDWLSPTHGPRSQKEDCTHGRHLEIGVDISWTTSL